MQSSGALSTPSSYNVMSHDIYENKIKIWAIKKNVQVKNA
jgi:hypothetical protein